MCDERIRRKRKVERAFWMVARTAWRKSADLIRNSLKLCGGAGSRTHVKGPNRNEARRGLTHQTHEIVWTGRSRSLPRRPT
jgi:hypothetical protein